MRVYDTEQARTEIVDSEGWMRGSVGWLSAKSPWRAFNRVFSRPSIVGPHLLPEARFGRPNISAGLSGGGSARSPVCPPVSLPPLGSLRDFHDPIDPGRRVRHLRVALALLDDPLHDLARQI